MSFSNILIIVFLTLPILLAEGPEPLPRWSPLNRPASTSAEFYPASKRHSKVEESFLDKFRKWDTAKKGPVPKSLADPFLGHAGAYEAVQPVASKLNTVECAHIPHHSILDYINDDRDLRGRLRDAVETRIRLEHELSQTDYPQNEEKLKTLKKAKDTLRAELNKPIRVNNWDKSLQAQYNANIKEISKLQKESNHIQTMSRLYPSVELNVAQRQEKIYELRQKNVDLKQEAEKRFQIPEKQAQLAELELEYSKLENVNKDFRKALDDHNANVKKAMSVLSIPYDQHRMFPTTGTLGLNDEIRALKSADAATTKSTMEAYDKAWISNMQKGITKGYLRGADKFARKSPDGKFLLGEDGQKIYDYQKLRDANFDLIKVGADTGSKAANGTTTHPQAQYMKRLDESYAQKFMTTSIYYVKTPEEGYGRLVNLYIAELKVYLKADFDYYKSGIKNLLERNKDFGWLSPEEFDTLSRHYDIEAVSKMTAKYNDIQDLIRMRTEKSENPFMFEKSADTMTPTLADKICSASSRGNGSAAAGGCIFVTKQHNDTNPQKPVAADHGQAKLNINTQPQPKSLLPSVADTASIDSKGLVAFLSQSYEGNINSVVNRKQIVEFVSENPDKLTGSPDDIARSKALIQQENLDSHNQQNMLARKMLTNPAAISTQPLTDYDKTRTSPSRFAANIAKFSSASEKASGSYGKLMLAKGFATAVRHEDYESLLRMGGGRTYLGAVLHGGKKMDTNGKTRVRRSLAETAGPVGGVADVGINIYSITKSAKRLNDPNASKFDQNDAIAELVADSIDIAVALPAIAAQSRSVFKMAPAALANSVMVTFAAAFYKPAKHVDRLNAEITLLDHERTTEYWRSSGGRNTSGYILELIDTKKANSMVVNMTVQLLINNPDYIGGVFPSRSLHLPEAHCHLEGQECDYILHFYPLPCEDWTTLSDCTGFGEYCSGDYKDRKCQADTGPGFTHQVAGHAVWTYRCRCEDDDHPAPQWGHELLNNEVDFRHEQYVFLQRAAPTREVPPGFSYLCKPSSLENEGDRVSVADKSSAYLCKGAIGIIREDRSGKFMLYELGTGTDIVRLSEGEKMDNLFKVGDGHKQFEGNAGDDTFVLAGPCTYLTGLLDGKGFRDEGNSLILRDECLPWSPIIVDLYQQILRLGALSVTVKNMHRIFGRKSQTDTIHTTCSSKLVVGGGGRSTSEPDYINVRSCSSSFKLTVYAEGSTLLDAINFSGGNVFVLIRDKAEFRAQIPKRFGGTITFQFEDVGSLTSAHIQNNGTEFVLGFSDGGSSTFQFHGSRQPPRSSSSTSCEPSKEAWNQISVFISFNSKFSGQLSYNLDEGRVQCLYNLEQEGGRGPISGYDFIDNVFRLKSGRWDVNGGKMTNDTFLLIRSDFPGIVDGRSGQNSLSFGNGLSENLDINLNTGFITGWRKIPIMNIQRVVGRDRFHEWVTVGCSTKFLDLGGATTDRVEIPVLPCSVNLTISVKGKASIADRSLNGTVVVLGSYESKGCSKPLPLELTLEGARIVLILNFQIKMLHLASPTFLEIDGGHQITFYPGKFPHVYFEEDSALKSTLVEEDGRVFAFHEISGTGSGATTLLRQGSSAIPNIFKLGNGSNWTITGGSLDDTFILTEEKFQGKIHGMGGVNALILPESDSSRQVSVNLQRKTLAFNNKVSLISFNGIQTVIGRKCKQDMVVCACDTKLVMLEGGGKSHGAQDLIEIMDGGCAPSTSFVIEEFTQVVNKASRGNFTYHVKASKNYDINYHPKNYSSHNFKFEMPLDQIKNVSLVGTSLEIGFRNECKTFPLNFHNLPTFQIVEGPELMAELILEVDRIPKTSVMARDPFSGSIFGLNGAENGIVVKTSLGIQSIMGGDKDDNIILSQAKSVLLINGGDGTNRLQFSEELHPTKRLEVDFLKKRASFLDEDKTSLVTILRGITWFTGREQSFERVTLGCDTKGVKFADEVVIRSNCGYNVTIEVGEGTRVIFDIGNDREPGLGTEVLQETEGDEEVSELNQLQTEGEYDSSEKELEKLEPSTFYYHFSTIQSFDIEIDSFSRLTQTRHIFYLNFTLSDLSSLRFSLNDSRLIYSTLAQQGPEYSHLVAEVEPSAMFYSQPEFMTADGFHLRISRYGEITAVVTNPQDHKGMEIVQQEVIPRLSAYSSQLGISFMVETGSEFIYCGCPGEISLLANRENVTSHLVGFNQTTYEILDLDNDVFIYPQRVGKDSVHVLDLSDIVFQIRNITRHKYVPEVAQIGNNLEIRMTNWTTIFPGKVILVNVTSSIKNFSILLNSIAMEILPVSDDEEPLPVTDSGVGNRHKRSVGEDMGTNWVMKPRPISIPEGHVYLLAAEDLEDGVVVRKGTADDDNSTFQYSRDEDDLIITSINTEGSGKSTSFIIFDYYAPSTPSSPALMESNDDHNGTLSFGKVETVNGIQVKLGKEAVIITSNEPIVSEETGEELEIGYFEDILDREEAKIVKGIPGMPRKFKISWTRKIGGTIAKYRNAAWGVILASTLFIGIIVWTFCRKKPETGKYSVVKKNQFQDENGEEIELASLVPVKNLADGVHSHSE